MSFVIKMKSLQTIYKSLGIENKGKVQLFLGTTVANNLKKYVSFKSGVQEGATRTIENGEKVIIDVPYARFQAGGKVMIGIRSGSPWARRGERKIVTDRNLKYHNSPLRGAHPFERMKADKRDSILLQTAKYARGIDNG